MSGLSRAASCVGLLLLAACTDGEPGAAAPRLGHARQALERATRLKDIQTALVSNQATSSSGPGVRVGSKVFFVVSTPEEGRELWVTDGTSPGTQLVRDITPGSEGSDPEQLTAVGTQLYFVARAPGLGPELWKSDGTAAGTVLLKDSVPGWNSIYPQNLTASGGRLFFTGQTQGEGRELWTSDGTGVGTVRVKDIFPGEQGSNPTRLTAANGTLFFVATDLSDRGAELWKSDGTAAGTVLVKDINPAQYQGAQINGMIALGSTVIFSATEDFATTGNELWRSDGTGTGTTLLRDIAAGSQSSSPSGFVLYNNEVYFSAYEPAYGNEVWKTNGTVTQLVRDIGPGASSGQPFGFTVANDLLFFTANDGATNQLWKTNGTTGGTLAVTTTTQFPSGLNAGSPTPVGALLVFSAWEATYGGELWKTDGTTTALVKDVRAGSDEWGSPASSSPAYLVSGGSYALFFADDGVAGTEPWRTDGVETGTTLLRDLTVDRSSRPTSLVGLNGRIFFAANEPVGHRLWSTDGTDVGTLRYSDVPVGVNDPALGLSGIPDQLVKAGTKLFFAGSSAANGVELWATDGVSPAAMVKDLMVNYGVNCGVPARTDSEGSYPMSITAMGDLVFFAAQDPAVSTEPFVSDGTAGGTFRLGDLNTQGCPNGGSSPRGFVTNGSVTLFTALNNSFDNQLFRTTGTTVSTGGLPGGVGYDNLTAVGSTFFLTANPGGLYKTDGTTAPVLVKDLGPNAYLSNLVNADGTLYFAGRDDVNGVEVWKSDGTAAGTVMVADVNPGLEDSSPSRFTVWPLPPATGAQVYFRAFRPDTGFELFRTDGTPGNVELVYDVTPGPVSGLSDLPFSTVSGAPLFFVASDGVRGNEPWGTEGTTASTAILDDIAAGPYSSNPSEIQILGERVYFSASDELGDREIWAIRTDQLDVTPPVVSCPADQAATTAQRADPTVAVSYPAATASDETSPGPFTIAYSHPSGSQFPVGSTTVTASTEDEAGNVGSCSFVVQVEAAPDTTPPTVTCPEPVEAQAGDNEPAAQVSYPAAVATDDVTAQPVLSYSAASGSSFPLGDNTVTVTATDDAGNSASCTFLVRVVGPPDTTPPVLTCPANQQVTAAEGASSAPVSYPAATATDDRTAAPAISYSAASGSDFPVGTTTVTATATDEAGNSASCSFTVVVEEASVSPSGCGCTTGADAFSSSALLLALIAFARRRGRVS